MVSSGQVRNGVVVLDDGFRLPEGERVAILSRDSVFATTCQKPHSILDIPPVSVGAVLRPLANDDDLLGEMLETRK